jgi:hypothetical protein
VFGTVFLIQKVVSLPCLVKVSIVTNLAGPPRECSSLLGFRYKCRGRDGLYGRWWGLRSEGDRRGSWPIRLALVWLISVRFGWGVIDLWWNICILKYSRPSIL